jgi:hypothetical protein
MAWATPFTAAAGGSITAANSNQTRDNLKALLPLDQVAWTSYTPTLTQSGTVTKTVTRAKYNQIGKQVTVSVRLDVTGSGTSNNAVTVTLPVTATASAGAGLVPAGAAILWDNSAGAIYRQVAYLVSTTTINFLDASSTSTSQSGITGAAFALALANLDVVAFEVTYEAA